MFARKEKKSLKENDCNELSECYVCGQNHSAEVCPFLSCQYAVEDAPTPSHARLTLPSNLEVKELADGTTTVVAREKFTRGTRFGPFQAALTSILPPEVNFPLKVFGSSEEDSFYLDTRNEDKCNWMCLVAPVSSSNYGQNLICYQVRNELYFSSLRDIEPGEELRVWYAPFYGIKMGVSPGKIPSPSPTLPQEMEVTEHERTIEERITWEADTTTGDVPSSFDAGSSCPSDGNKFNGPPRMKEKEHGGKDDLQLKKEILEKAMTSYVAQQLPPRRLGARFSPPCWRCRECGAKEVSVISYARHLMRHLKPSTARAKNFPCSLCHKKFFTQELLDAHEESRHGLFGLLPPPLPPPAIPQSGNDSNEHLCLLEKSQIKNELPPMVTKEVIFPKETLGGVLEESVASVEKENENKKSEVVISSPCEISITLDPVNESSCQPCGDFSEEQNTTLRGCTPQNKNPVLENVPLHSDALSKPCSSLINVVHNSGEESQINGENSRTLVAVMGPSGLNYLVIPVDQGKNVNTLLQNIQEPVRDKSVSFSSGLPETILNHDFFTCVAGDTVHDVKSLLSKGYSLQFLVEDEDGSSSLVDVLSTANGTPDQVTSSTDLFQTGKVSSQQLVIMANGNIPQNLPVALQNILPPSVPIVPSVSDSVSVNEIPLLSQSSVMDVTTESLNITNNTPLSPCLQTENSFLKKSDSVSATNSALDNLLAPVIETNMCYDSASFADSNAANTSLIDMNLTGKVLDKEGLDYGLGALELPLAVEDTNSTDYILNTCSPPPSSPKPVDLQAELNTELNTPVKLLDQCISSSLSSDVMSFDFENAPITSLGNPLEDKSSECGDGLTKDFNDLIAADADSTNMVLNIQPADSTAEISKTLSETGVNMNNKSTKDRPAASVNWLESEGFTLQSSSSNTTMQTNVIDVNVQSSVDITFGPSTLDFNKLSHQDLNPGVIESPNLNSFNPDADLDGLLLATHSRNASEEISPSEPCVVVPGAAGVAESQTISDDAEAEIEPSYISSGPPFTCDICNKSFGRSGYLYRHLRKHTGEFTCVACRAVFARKETLQLHECSAQPSLSVSNSSGCLSCPFCQKRFAVKRQLTRHIANHNSSRRHQCSTCDRTFTSKDSAEQHSQVCSGRNNLSRNEQELQNQAVEKVTAGAVPSEEIPPQASEVQVLSCSTCHRVFLSKAALQRHCMIQHSGSQGEEMCEQCGRTLAFASAERKKNHISVCSPAAALQAGSCDTAVCPKCDEPFRQLVMYRQHVYRHTHAHTCAHCRRAFVSIQERGKHVCLGIWEQCCECGNRFATVSQLEKHALSHGVPNHHCFECGRSFHKIDDFGKHRCFELSTKISHKNGKSLGDSKDLLSSSHKNVQKKRTYVGKSRMCEVCGEVYKNVSSLKLHRFLHGERRFECSVCKKRFHRKDVLAEHMYVHQDAQLRCNVCSKLLKSKKSLDVHMRQHLDRKHFACQQCGKEYHQKVNLQKHMERHGPRPEPVSCSHCGRSFQAPETLAKHVLEHHSEGPRFPCTICNHSFVKENMLRRHMELHTTGGLLCPVCGQTLKYRSSLRRHLLKLHPELGADKKAPPEGTSNNAPEVLLTVSQLQLTTDGVQQLSLTESATVEGTCLLEQGSLNTSEDMVLYVLQEPLSCLPLEESSS